jgi:hypothetical protein
MFLGLIFNIAPNHICGHFVPYTPDKVAVTPQFPRPKLSSQPAKLLENLSCRHTLQYLHHFRWRVFWWHLQKHMHMVFHYLQGVHPKPIVIRYSLKHCFSVFSNLTYQDFPSIFRYPDQMVLDIENCVLCPSNSHASFIQEKVIFKQTPLPRLTASRFPPASKLTGIQRGFL